MLLNYIYYGLTVFTTNNLVVRNNCVASKQASKQASKLIYNKNFRAKAQLPLFVMGFILCKQG